MGRYGMIHSLLTIDHSPFNHDLKIVKYEKDNDRDRLICNKRNDTSGAG